MLLKGVPGGRHGVGSARRGRDGPDPAVLYRRASDAGRPHPPPRATPPLPARNRPKRRPPIHPSRHRLPMAAACGPWSNGSAGDAGRSRLQPNRSDPSRPSRSRATSVTSSPWLRTTSRCLHGHLAAQRPSSALRAGRHRTPTALLRLRATSPRRSASLLLDARPAPVGPSRCRKPRASRPWPIKAWPPIPPAAAWPPSTRWSARSWTLFPGPRSRASPTTGSTPTVLIASNL